MERSSSKRVVLQEPHTILFLAFEGMGLLDFAGPFTVFGSASHFLKQSGKPGYNCHVASVTGGPIILWDGIPLVTAALPNITGPADTIVVPGGPPADVVLADARLVAWLAQHGTTARRICSVCSGAFLLAEAGFLDGRRATTHWQECANLQKRYPRTDVREDSIFVRDDPIWTSAGVTAGIDLALALVKEDHGHELAMRIARQMVVFLKRQGGQSQFSTMLEAQTADDEIFADLHRWLVEHLDDPKLTIETLAEKACMSVRNFARVYKSTTGRTPGKAIELFRLEAARRLLEDTDYRVETIARRTGFGDEERMRMTFQRHLGTSPRQYRERFGK